MENTTCSKEFSTASTVVLLILNGTSGLVTVCGNFLVLMALVSTPALHVASNVFIGSLAAADFTIGLVMNPIYSVIVTRNITNREHGLNIAEQFLWIHTVITTTFNLAAMSVERYIAVIFPLRYSHVITSRRCLVAVAGIWSFSLSFVCTRAFVHEAEDIQTLWIVHSVIAIAFPLCVIAFCYFHIFRAIKKQRRRIHHFHGFKQNMSSEMNAKAAGTMAIVILFFILFWAPNIVMTILNFFAKGDFEEMRIFQIWVWCASVAFVGSSVNPFVYSIRIQGFRLAIKRICRCR